MRYCLLSRFQGAWLGGVLGEALVTKEDSCDRLKITNYQASQWLKSRNNLATAIANQQRLPIPLSSDSERLALVVLPLVLLSHDNFPVLQNSFANLEFTSSKNHSISPREENQAEMFRNVLLWGYAISLALREKLNADNPLEQILAGVGANLTRNTLTKLQKVKQTLKQGRALDDRHLSAIALSISCFADAPNDFYLAVCRARSISGLTIDFKQVVTIMTATLSGAYNGLAAIPANWQIFGNQNQIYRQEQKTAVNLFNNWLGIYQPQQSENCSLTVAAAPKIIQTRSSLNIVSQTDY